MFYSMSIKLKTGTKELRDYLRQNGFNVYKHNHANVFIAEDANEEDLSSFTHYQCIYNNSTPPPQEVFKKLAEKSQKDKVLGFSLIYQ